MSREDTCAITTYSKSATYCTGEQCQSNTILVKSTFIAPQTIAKSTYKFELTICCFLSNKQCCCIVLGIRSPTQSIAGAVCINGTEITIWQATLYAVHCAICQSRRSIRSLGEFFINYSTLVSSQFQPSSVGGNCGSGINTVEDKAVCCNSRLVVIFPCCEVSLPVVTTESRTTCWSNYVIVVHCNFQCVVTRFSLNNNRSVLCKCLTRNGKLCQGILV